MLKDYVISRAIDSQNNPTMCNRIKDDVRWYRDNSKNPWDIFRKSIQAQGWWKTKRTLLSFNAWKSGMLGKRGRKSRRVLQTKKIK